ncbi:putative membrane protein At1g16860 [Bidens hawaiensis]|uniref:putative membrane protein At1g16860 n=1 Tax=Bidens hawaiensis TaxID=980011 RepID=UPI00404B0044
MGTRIPSHQLSNGLFVSGRPEPHKDRPPTISSRAVPYTGGDVKHSGDLAKMFDIPHRKSSSSGSFRSGPNSGSGSGPIPRPTSGLHPTGLLLTSGPIGSRRSGQLDPNPHPPGSNSNNNNNNKGKTIYGSAVTTLGFDDVRLGFKVSKTLMWMLLVIAVIGLMVGTFLMVAVKKPLILVSVVAVLVLAGAVIMWNCVIKKRRLLSFLRNYPDAELRGAVDGQFVKVTGIVTCGSIALESSFQKVSRCVYVSTELYEYKGLGGKPVNPKHRCFTWGCRNSEKYIADFYISDFQSGLRAVVKAGYGAKVAPFVKETAVIDITKEKLDSSPDFVTWLAERSLSHDNRVMRLKEGYIKEGSTVSVMGVVRRHDNVLMIVPPTDPISTGCQWACGLFPTYVEGLVLKCDESQNADVIPV